MRCLWDELESKKYKRLNHQDKARRQARLKGRKGESIVAVSGCSDVFALSP